MSKLDDFKKFVAKHSEFVDYVRNNNISWQNLYELYDIYGEDEEVWKKYLKNDIKDNKNLKGLLNTMKNINLDSLEENLNSIQKAVSLVEELTKKTVVESKTNLKSKEINNLYGD